MYQQILWHDYRKLPTSCWHQQPGTDPISPFQHIFHFWPLLKTYFSLRALPNYLYFSIDFWWHDVEDPPTSLTMILLVPSKMLDVTGLILLAWCRESHPQGTVSPTAWFWSYWSLPKYVLLPVPSKVNFTSWFSRHDKDEVAHMVLVPTSLILIHKSGPVLNQEEHNKIIKLPTIRYYVQSN